MQPDHAPGSVRDAAPGTDPRDALRDGLGELVATTDRVRHAIESVLHGRPDLARLTVAVLLAGGHLLVEDVPGVGKTTLAKAVARSIDCRVGRVQFTPDLLPSDLTGVNVYRTTTGEFEFRPGPVFNNVVIGDEINRASPKTQSALLECMEEGHVTVDGTTHPLPRPFLVVATQNPVEMEGTYPLPEAQRDRFAARLSVGYPSTAAELAMLDSHALVDPIDRLEPVTTAEVMTRLAGWVRAVHASNAVKQYVVDLVGATRDHEGLRLGASPRASLQLLRVARAHAAMSGRLHVLPDDVQALAVPVLAHRLVLSTESRLTGRTEVQVVEDVLARTPVPAGGAGHAPAAGGRRA
ncbi:MoxR-like ATPase [Isoptericola jiangsuensis]|uniref:MoxR-like ATPase n=1 Tax=Isoptericola jiangsuensis TaxID=548579 RepID=A0A2A9EWE3_9MICO|nr:MoxR family ATPase [Isoptericola jiangsuensis]PFG42841.1 MoxR-like ATPase [Isoptericola jiangsuensis]